jgi:hypothetical protein
LENLKKSHLFTAMLDPDRQALDADPDLDPAK